MLNLNKLQNLLKQKENLFSLKNLNIKNLIEKVKKTNLKKEQEEDVEDNNKTFFDDENKKENEHQNQNENVSDISDKEIYEELVKIYGEDIYRLTPESRKVLALMFKYKVEELQTLRLEEFDIQYQVNIFLKYPKIREEFIKDFIGNFEYYETIDELKKQFDINSFFEMLDKDLQKKFIQRNILYLVDKLGNKYIGLYYPNIYFKDIDFDGIFFFGNQIYNYYFKTTTVNLLEEDQTLTVDNLLQYMELEDINDLAIDPINDTQYIITAEKNRKNVLLTEIPIPKETIKEFFNYALTKMGKDPTTEFPIMTGLYKINLVTKNNLLEKRTFRFNFINTKKGYTLDIRKFMNYSDIQKLGLSGLGYLPEAMEIMNEALDSRHGINIIIGETNSGKSTLLYTLLNKLYKEQLKIISIENPVEIEMPFLQIDLTETETADEQFKMTKEKALKGILRHNPNVVLINEIRSADEIEFFVGLGLRGHMAFTTLHTGSVLDSINILLKNSKPEELASSLNMLVHQELLPKVCPDCKGKGKINGEICLTCKGSGTKGVVPVYEIAKFSKLTGTDDLLDLPSLIKKQKLKYISKNEVAEKLFKDGKIFEKDYKRIINNNINWNQEANK